MLSLGTHTRAAMLSQRKDAAPQTMIYHVDEAIVQ